MKLRDRTKLIGGDGVRTTSEVFDFRKSDLVEIALRDFERKRDEIDAAIASILATRPDLRAGKKAS